MVITSPVKGLTLLVLLLFCHSSYGARFRWEIQVTDPQFELNYKTLSDDKHKPFLPKTSWRCYVGPVQEKNTLEMRTLHCDYSVEKAGQVTTLLSCSDQKDYGEVSFELFDERKNLTFTVMLICRKK